MLPQGMQYVSYLPPPSYVFEGMRQILADGTAPGKAMLWGGFPAVLYILLACRFFLRTYRHVVRAGLNARYSAESVT